MAKDDYQDALTALKALQDTAPVKSTYALKGVSQALILCHALHSETLAPQIVILSSDGQILTSSEGASGNAPLLEGTSVSAGTVFPDRKVVQHYKGGLYSRLAVLSHEGEPYVLYISHSDGVCWIRPKDMFEDGRFQPRPDLPAQTPAGFS